MKDRDILCSIMTKRKAIYPGSFDPLTNGHVDLVLRGLELFDEVIIGILSNPSKDSLFTVSERAALIESVFKKNKKVTVKSFTGLLVDFAQKQKVNSVIRGLRAISDFDYEAQMALTNRKLSDLETVFLMAREENSYVSSTVVKQVARYGGNVSQFVPAPVAKALKDKFTKKPHR